jgi:hypothetical protein
MENAIPTIEETNAVAIPERSFSILVLTVFTDSVSKPEIPTVRPTNVPRIPIPTRRFGTAFQ